MELITPNILLERVLVSNVFNIDTSDPNNYKNYFNYWY